MKFEDFRSDAQVAGNRRETGAVGLVGLSWVGGGMGRKGGQELIIVHFLVDWWRLH